MNIHEVVKIRLSTVKNNLIKNTVWYCW